MGLCVCPSIHPVCVCVCDKMFSYWQKFIYGNVHEYHYEQSHMCIPLIVKTLTIKENELTGSR